MIEIIEKSINYDELGNSSSDRYTYKLVSANFMESESILSLKLETNFVMDYFSLERIKLNLMNVVPSLDDVKISFKYKDMVQTKKEIISTILKNLKDSPHERSPWINAIRADKFTIEEGTLKINSCGINATENLNQKTANVLHNAMKKRFGMDLDVLFVHDREEYEKIKQRKLKQELEEIKQAEKYLQYNSRSDDSSKSKANNKKDTGFKKKKSKSRKKKNDVYGYAEIGDPINICDIHPELNNVTVRGMIFRAEHKELNTGKILFTIYINDNTSSTLIKIFTEKKDLKELTQKLSKGKNIVVTGNAAYDKFESETVIIARGVKSEPNKFREDDYNGKKRVELHAHTKMSAMDGLIDVKELVGRSARWGHEAVAITDHGVVQSFPDGAKIANELSKDGKEIKVIYGLEGYVFDDGDMESKDGEIDYKSKPTNHIILLAKNQEGLKNIYKLVSLSHLKYFYKKPRLPKSIITKYRDGIIIGSACEAGEIYRAIVSGKSDDEIKKIASFYDYLEIQPVINNRFMVEAGIVDSNDDLRNFNLKVLEIGDALGKPVVATTDAHYDEPESAIYRNILMAGMGYKDAERGQGLYMRTTEEMLDEFSYLGDRAKEVVIDNSLMIADSIEKLRPVPQGKFPPKIQGSDETLRKSCLEKAHKIYGNPLPEKISERLNKELDSIISNGYAVMYVAAQMLVKKSLEDGYLVGSRGSVGSSFAATMAGITEVNPLEPHYICPKCKHLEWGDMSKYDCGIDMPEKICPDCGTVMNRDGFTIPFATFLGFDGDKEPDIDLNFAGEYQAKAHKYVGEIFGEKNVFKAGTVGTIADKTAYGYVKKFFEETQWNANKYEIDRLTRCCTGVRKTTGQHPGGIIIVPDGHEIYEFCPVQHPANDSKTDIITTHFDYHKIDENLLKLDILGHTIPSMIKHLYDMTGVDPTKIPLNDPKVMKLFLGPESLDIKDEDYEGKHGTYGIPEFGTKFVREMLDDTKPDKFADLVRISGFSHGSDVWLNNAKDYIKSGVATMREVISTRDDIMNYLILKKIDNKKAFEIMEKVRKNRDLTEDDLKTMFDHGVPQWYVDSCIKIKYMFPRAHAVAYVMMSMRMAWYKVYYPKEFYAAYFSSVVEDFETATILQGKDAISNYCDMIYQKGKDATDKEKNKVTVFEVALEMLARGFEFATPILGISQPTRYLVHDGKVLIPYAAVNGMGENAANNFWQEQENEPYSSIVDATKRAKLTKVAVEELKNLGVFDGLSETDQFCFF
ncbi:MAG: PolC-type DNA polymerase III [Clostridiales bacterium]|nr:PolC-type DNA polymerase III [Clostridiales bacterium]MDY6117316.1 PolC-type DNA polymerase III [Anaerovoracaceae bacterium]